MFKTLYKAYCLLTQSEKKYVLILFGPMILAAIINVIGIAFVVPFVAIVANPTSITQKPKLAWMYHTLHFHSPHYFLLTLGGMVLAMLVIGNGIGALTTWMMLKFVNLRSFTISKRLLSAYLQKPYDYFLQTNSATLAKNILLEVDTVCQQILKHALDMLARAIALFFVIALLLLFNPLLAIIISIVLGGSYAAIYASVRKKLGHISDSHIISKEKRYKSVYEAFGGIKEIKLYNTENVFIDHYSQPAKAFATQEATSQIIAQTPRYALEVIAFGGIMLIVLFLLATHSSVTSIMPLLALYAFAGYRLMPGLQVIFGSITSIRAYQGALDTLAADLQQPLKSAVSKKKSIKKRFTPQNITLQNITFTYQNQEIPTLNQLHLHITAGSKIGIVGETGSGKTTLVDIILGLLQPQHGELLADDRVITQGNLATWQNSLGYVPQHIYLSDDTIANNIAFGIDSSHMDVNKIRASAEYAQLDEFISQLPQGYQSRAGERGVCLSGGQRQRIGLARAFYRDPQILILDEATSALDNITEHKIMQFVTQLPITTIIIAHRLSTIRNCDVIYVLQKGRIQAQGTYDELVAQNSYFKHLTAAGEHAI